MRLSVNVDHFATLREARRAAEPEPVLAALLAEQAGADGITAHLRGDRRHIKERDLRLIREVIKTKLTLEMAATGEMRGSPRDQARHRLPRPGAAGGADDDGRAGRGRPPRNSSPLHTTSSPRPASGSASSSIRSRTRSRPAAALGVPQIEIHTGIYAKAKPGRARDKALADVVKARREGRQARPRSDRRPRARLSQRRPDRRHPGDHRAQHRVFDRRPGRHRRRYARPSARWSPC